MKNVKKLTAVEWEKYTTETAEALLKRFPQNSSNICYGDFQHPEIENMFGIEWKGPERDKWLEDVKAKYEKMRVKRARHFAGFDTPKDLKKIKSRKDIKSLIITHQYEDDHLQCAETRINGVEIGFHYYDDLGFLKYWKDSPTAFKDLLQSLKCSIQCWEDEQDEA